MVRRIIFAEDLSQDLVEIRGIACLQIPVSLRTSKRPSDERQPFPLEGYYGLTHTVFGS